MARPTQPKIARPDPVEPDDSDTELPSDAGETDDLSVMMASLAGSVASSVTVYRVTKGSPLAYVFACTPDAFSLDELRDKYNGGEFRLYITKDGKLWKNKRVYVEQRQPPVQVERPSALTEMAESMREAFAKQAEVIREVTARAAAPVAPGASPWAGLDIPAIISAITGAVVAFRPPPAPPAPAAPPADAAGSIDLFIRGLELGRELRQDGGGGEPTLMGMLSDVIKSPMLAQAAQAAMRPPIAPRRPAVQQIRQAPAVQPQVPPPTAHQPDTTTIQESSPMSADSNHFAAGYLAMLCGRAAAGSDPGLYADLVLDNVDDKTLDAIVNGQPTPVDFLAAFHAPVLEHREWFERLLAVMIEALDADSNNEAQSGELSPPGASHAPPTASTDVPS